MAYNNVENLLKECANPEIYNFECECDYEEYKNLSPLERFLVYKSTGEGHKISNSYVHKQEDVEYYYRSALFSLDNYWRYPNLVDCDGWDGECSLAVDLYKVLWNWKPYGTKYWESQFGELEGLGSFGGDTLNSVQTTLNQYLEFMLDDNEEYRQHMEGSKAGIGFCLQLYCIYGKDFMKHFEQTMELMQFIELCHTPGNLVLVPAGYNGYRGVKPYIRDYADLSLDNLKYSRDGKDFLGEDDKDRKRNFNRYINTVFLWDSVDENYDVVPLCESHGKKLEMYKRQNTKPDAEFVLPNKEEIDGLCRNINNRIRRSIFMTAMLRIALGINLDGTEAILQCTYNGKYGKWADWNVSGIYKLLMKDVFMTDKVYSGGYEEVVKVIKDTIAGNPDERFVSNILFWMVANMNLQCGDEIRDKIDSNERANSKAGFISKEELGAIVEDAIEGEKRFEQFQESLKNNPEAGAQWGAQKKEFLDIDISCAIMISKPFDWEEGLLCGISFQIFTAVMKSIGNCLQKSISPQTMSYIFWEMQWTEDRNRLK